MIRNRPSTVAERLRALVQAIELATDDGRSVPLTPSIGVAEHRPETEALSALMVRADQALYKAKESGRNRLECFEEYHETKKGSELP